MCFAEQPEALSQLDTSQSDLMVLDADLWIVRDRGDVCSSDECIYKVRLCKRYSAQSRYNAYLR